MNIKKNECYELEITGVTSEGNGVGRLDGFAIFVPETTVGDIVLVKIVKILKSYGFGIIEKIIKPSSNRVEVDCDCYKQCGGCTYRHITYEAELAIKQEYVANSFKRIGAIGLACNNIIASEIENEYRNKAQYPVGKNKDGNIVSGFYAKRSHRIINCEQCKLQPKDFSDIQSIVINFLNEQKISVYDEESNKGLVRHIYVRKAESTGEIMVCIVVTNANIPNTDKLCDELKKGNSNITSIIINVNSKPTNVILGNQCKIIYGNDYITDIICSIKIKISPLSFYQVNKKQAEVLYNTAIDYANLIDLYCGTGTIGLISANKVKQVIGIEIISQAIQNANENAITNNITNARFICADASEATKQLLEEGISPNVVIVDPPRKGLENDVIEAIVNMSPERVVMVSCNPATAARDANLLEKSGYKVTKITPVDMFPRTTHVETVILMTRCGKNDK